MKFDVCGGFEIYRDKYKHGVFDKAFWERVAAENASLPQACGCYVFALNNGSNIVPWYVGKAEKSTFQKESFQAAKKVVYNDVLVKHNGKALLFFLPRLTVKKGSFSKPTKAGYRDVDFLETMLIGFALEKNRELCNIKKTKLLRELVVPGVVNSPQGPPTKAQRDLKNALGLK